MLICKVPSQWGDMVHSCVSLRSMLCNHCVSREARGARGAGKRVMLTLTAQGAPTADAWYGTCLMRHVSDTTGARWRDQPGAVVWEFPRLGLVRLVLWISVHPFCFWYYTFLCWFWNMTKKNNKQLWAWVNMYENKCKWLTINGGKPNIHKTNLTKPSPGKTRAVVFSPRRLVWKLRWELAYGRSKVPG